MNNGRVRKSLNTLIRAYKKKNRERNINIKMEKQFQHLLKKEQIQ